MIGSNPLNNSGYNINNVMEFKMNTLIKYTSLTSLLLFSTVACTGTQYKPDTVSSGRAQQECSTYKGTVIANNDAVITKETKRQQAVGAGLAGWAAYELLGSYSSVTKILGTALAAGGGAWAGDKVAQATGSTVRADQLTVSVEYERYNGEPATKVITTTQAKSKYNYEQGDDVWVIGSISDSKERSFNCQLLAVIPI